MLLSSSRWLGQWSGSASFRDFHSSHFGIIMISRRISDFRYPATETLGHSPGCPETIGHSVGCPSMKQLFDRRSPLLLLGIEVTLLCMSFVLCGIVVGIVKSQNSKNWRNS